MGYTTPLSSSNQWSYATNVKENLLNKCASCNYKIVANYRFIKVCIGVMQGYIHPSMYQSTLIMESYFVKPVYNKASSQL